MWTPIDGRILSIDDAVATVATIRFDLGFGFLPSGGVLHNTSVPSLKRSLDYPIAHWRDMWVGFYRDTKGWSAGPHYFCFWDKVLLFTPLNHRGTHSPSWNGTKFGLEMVADFDTEDDKSGQGLALKHNAARMFAAIYGRMGWEPEGIKMHYEDPKTTHACPGKHLSKAEFIGEVLELLGHAGEHPATTVPPPAAPPRIMTVNLPKSNFLNMRTNSNAISPSMLHITGGEKVTLLGEAKNGSTSWSRIKFDDQIGWVASRFLVP